MHVAGRGSGWRVEVGVRIQPEHEQLAPVLGGMSGYAVHRAHGEAVVTSEQDRTSAPASDVVGASAQGARPRGDLRKVTSLVRCMGQVKLNWRGHREITLVHDLMAEFAQALHDPRRSQGGGSHDSARLACADVDRHTDDADVPWSVWASSPL